MSWTPADDPSLGLCRRAASGARLVEPLDGLALAQLLTEYRGPFALTVGPPEAPGDATRVWIDLAPFVGVGPVTGGGLAVRAGAAATWGAVEAHLAQEGLTLGPLPGWVRSERIYETLARGARRRPSPRYGELLDGLLAVQAALPGGGLTRSAVAPRRATGPDLARGVVGAAHGAGVPVAVHLQAWPRPQGQSWRAVAFQGWPQALTAGVAALRAGARPAWWRFAAELDRVVCLAGFAGDGGLSRFDEVMGGLPLEPERAQALAAAVFEGEAPAPAPGWVGPVREAAARAAAAGGVVWDLRPEGATVHGAEPAAVDPGWAALADAARAALEAGP